MGDELELLAASAGDGKNWGFQFNMLPGSAQSVINIALPAFMARLWTITLTRFRYGTGVLSSIATTSTNPDAQTYGDDTKCQLQWGIGGAAERCVFDYPRLGTSFELAASFVRLYVQAPSTVVIQAPGQPPPLSPLVGAFACPFGRGGAMQDVYPGLTFSSPQVTLATATSTLVNIPDRARAYRLIGTPSGLQTLGGAWRVRQQTGFGANISHDYASTEGLGESLLIFDGTSNHLYPQRELWIPLNSNAEMLEVLYTLVASSGTFFIQFMLDLG